MCFLLVSCDCFGSDGMLSITGVTCILAFSRLWSQHHDVTSHDDTFWVFITFETAVYHHPVTLRGLLQVGSQDGRLAVFDLTVNQFKAVETVDVIGLDHPIHAVSFCPSQENAGWLGVSNVDTISLYRLSTRLSGGPRALTRNVACLTKLLHQKHVST